MSSYFQNRESNVIGFTARSGAGKSPVFMLDLNTRNFILTSSKGLIDQRSGSQLDSVFHDGGKFHVLPNFPIHKGINLHHDRIRHHFSLLPRTVYL